MSDAPIEMPTLPEIVDVKSILPKFELNEGNPTFMMVTEMNDHDEHDFPHSLKIAAGNNGELRITPYIRATFKDILRAFTKVLEEDKTVYTQFVHLIEHHVRSSLAIEEPDDAVINAATNILDQLIGEHNGA